MPCHPAQQQDPTRDKCPDVEESVRLVPARGLGFVCQDEELSGVKEDRVDLHHEGEGAIRDVGAAGDGEAVAERDAEVVNQQLVSASLSVVLIFMSNKFVF